ncbi:winged helix-turn-helix domain-containing protein [Streptomyces sp. NPDC003444]
MWTRRLIDDLIAKLYRVRLTDMGVGKYLKRSGCSSSTRTSEPSSRTSCRRTRPSRTPTSWSTPISSTACPAAPSP